MQREIKFRAWVTRYDEPYMLYLKPNITWVDVENGLIISFTEDGEDYGYNEVIEKNIDYPLMQYTGLKDKNGKDIYEGDIIKIDEVLDEIDFITDVYFDKGAFRYRHSDSSGSVMDFVVTKKVKYYELVTHDVEVIGNIYESKSLLDNTDTKV